MIQIKDYVRNSQNVTDYIKKKKEPVEGRRVQRLKSCDYWNLQCAEISNSK